MLFGCGDEATDVEDRTIVTYSSLGNYSCTENEMRRISTLFPDHGFLAAAPILRPDERFTVTRIRYWVSDGGTCNPETPHEAVIFTVDARTNEPIDARSLVGGGAGRPNEIELFEPLVVMPDQRLLMYLAGRGDEASTLCIGTCPNPPPGVAEASLFVTEIDDQRSESRFLNETQIPQGFRFEVDGYEDARSRRSSAR
ncbi:MAG: hypothetical protein AAFV29_02925 [Myxococcota bacterium]